jgi:uncharacterized protein (DUF2141 family)
MVRILITLVIYLISIVGYAQFSKSKKTNLENNGELKVNVEINNIGSDKGKVYFAIYDSASNFSKKKPINGGDVKVVNGKVKITFDYLKPGVYAVTCYYDTNNNGKMDFENNGMPLEDYGATNNVMNYGPPRFEDAKFELKDKDLTFEIKF